MPVYRLIEEMPYEELLGWFAYLDKRPIEWRDDDRAYKYLQTQGYKGKPWEVFPSLGAIYRSDSVAAIDGKIEMKSFKGSYLFHKMLSAKGGDKIDFSENSGN